VDIVGELCGLGVMAGMLRWEVLDVEGAHGPVGFDTLAALLQVLFLPHGFAELIMSFLKY
jgi:hypothetical protein